MATPRFVYGPTGATYTHESSEGPRAQTTELEFELLDAAAAEELLTWPAAATRRELLTLAAVSTSEIEHYDDLGERIGVDSFLSDTLERFPAWENASEYFADGRLHQLAATGNGPEVLLSGGGSTTAGWSAAIVGSLAAFERVAALVDPNDAIIARDDDVARRARAKIGA